MVTSKLGLQPQWLNAPSCVLISMTTCPPSYLTQSTVLALQGGSPHTHSSIRSRGGEQHRGGAAQAMLRLLHNTLCLLWQPSHIHTRSPGQAQCLHHVLAEVTLQGPPHWRGKQRYERLGPAAGISLVLENLVTRDPAHKQEHSASFPSLTSPLLTQDRCPSTPSHRSHGCTRRRLPSVKST